MSLSGFCGTKYHMKLTAQCVLELKTQLCNADVGQCKMFEINLIEAESWSLSLSIFRFKVYSIKKD